MNDRDRARTVEALKQLRTASPEWSAWAAEYVAVGPHFKRLSAGELEALPRDEWLAYEPTRMATEREQISNQLSWLSENPSPDARYATLEIQRLTLVSEGYPAIEQLEGLKAADSGEARLSFRERARVMSVVGDARSRQRKLSRVAHEQMELLLSLAREAGKS